MAGFTVENQNFLLVSAQNGGIVSTPVGGLLGLAFEALASTKAVPFWQALVNANQLSAPEMSFWLARDTAAELTNSNTNALLPGGTFTLGGVNSSLFSGEIDFVNMPSANPNTFWLLSLSNLTVNGSAVAITTGALAAIDTGTTLIGGPGADVEAIYNSIPDSTSLGGGFYSFPCNTPVTISLSFGSHSWPINPSDFNTGQVSRRNGVAQCRGAIFNLAQGTNSYSPPSSSEFSPAWVIGDTFLKNVYSVFRAPTSSSSTGSVGFAQLSTAAGGSGTSAGESPTDSGSSSSGAMPTTFSALLILSTAFTTVIMLCL